MVFETPDRKKFATGGLRRRCCPLGCTVLIPSMVLATLSIMFAVQYPLWPNRSELLDQGKLVDYEKTYRLIFVLSVVIWFWCLWQLLPRFQGVSFSRWCPVILPMTLVMYVSFVLMYPTNATDVFIYAARSRLFSTYGVNPNAVLPATYATTDPYIAFASQGWAETTSPYGPLWNLIAWPWTRFDGGSAEVAVVGFKVLAVGSILAIGVCIYDIVRLRHPEWALTATMFWLWNPLVIWEGIGNGHNDVVMMVPIVAAFWAWQHRRDSWVIPLLVVAMLIKYVAILLVPLAIVAIWRRHPLWRVRLEIAIIAAVGSIGLTVVSLAPFFQLGPVWRSAQAQEARMSDSIAWFVWATIRMSGRASGLGLEPIAPATIQWIAYAIVAMAVTMGMVLIWKRPDRLLRLSFEVMFVFLIVGSTNQRSWYVIWLVPLAALVIPELPWRRTMLFCATSLLVRAFTIWSWPTWDWERWGGYGFGAIVVGITLMPVLLVTGWELAVCLRQRLHPASDVRIPGRESTVVPTVDDDLYHYGAGDS